MNFRRFSLGGDTGENEIDTAFKNLYPPSTVLERRCEESLKENLSYNFRFDKPAQKRIIGRVKISNGKSIEQIMNTLSSQYFTQEYDPVEMNLIEISSWKENDITQKFMSKIEDSDNDKDIIVSHLTSMIDANYDQLMECMKKIQEINVDLFEAGMLIKHSRLKIISSINHVDNGSISITNLTKKREKLAGLIDVLRGLKAVKDIYRTMNLKLKTGDVGDAAEYARDVFYCFKQSSFSSFTALDTINNNLQKTICTIKLKTDKALRRLSCRKFATYEYDSIIKSYLILNNLLSQVQLDQNEQFCEIDDDDGSIEETVNGNCLENLVQRITKFQLEDIDGCFHSAVMELIYLAQQQKQHAAAEVEVEGAYQQLRLEDIMNLTEIPLNLLYKRITPELFPKCVIRCCELLAEVIHTHYLITQWHSSPFDPKNADLEFLHRNNCFLCVDKFDDSEDETDRKSQSSMSGKSSSEDEEEEEEEEVFHTDNSHYNPKLNFSSLNESLARSVYGKDISSMFVQKLIRQLKALMTLQYHNLTNSREMLWKELTNGIVSMLNCLTFTSSTKFEDFIAMVKSLRMMMLLGKDFCGSSSKVLEDSIREKSEEFMFNFHLESFQVIRMMIEAESWRNISIYCDDKDTILNILSSFVRESGEDDLIFHEARSTVSNIGILQSFYKSGNPFSSIGEETQLGNNIHEFRHIGDFTSNNFSNIIDLLHDALSEELKKGKGSKKVSSMLMNQVALNGITKFLMKYLNIMCSLPSAASSIFDYICQLFDFYLCSVFYGFTSLEEKNKLLSVQSKFVAPPDNCREFEILQSFLERSMGGMICVGCSAQDSDVSKEKGVKRNYDMVKVSSLLSVPLVIDEADSPSFFAVTERITAAESCGFLSQVLLESKYLFSKLLPEKDIHKCDSYIDNFVMISGQLRSFIYKAMCPQLHFADQVVGNILECSWEAKKAREMQHPWVDRLISINKQIWCYLLEVNQFGESAMFVREQVWLEICQSAFDIAIEGFSRVRKCSSEGRAAMSMDIFALHDGLNNIHLCRPPRGKHYVDNYLRAFYMNEEEIMRWVQDNWQSYSYRHIHGLLSQTMTSMLNSKKLKDALLVIDGLYENDNDNMDKVSSIFNTRYKEENKLSNILTSKFRR